MNREVRWLSKIPSQGRNQILSQDPGTLNPVLFPSGAPPLRVSSLACRSPGNCCLHGLAWSSYTAGKGHLHLWLSVELKLELTGEWLCHVFTQHPSSAKPSLPPITDLLWSEGCKTQHNANSGLKKKKKTQQSKSDFCGYLPFPAISTWSWWTEVLL